MPVSPNEGDVLHLKLDADIDSAFVIVRSPYVDSIVFNNLDSQQMVGDTILKLSNNGKRSTTLVYDRQFERWYESNYTSNNSQFSTYKALSVSANVDIASFEEIVHIENTTSSNIVVTIKKKSNINTISGNEAVDISGFFFFFPFENFDIISN